MLAEMTVHERRDWLIYAGLDPFGEEREDHRNAHVVQTLINLYRGKNRPVRKLHEFVLPFGDYVTVKPQMSWQSMKASMQAFAAAYGVEEKKAG